MGNLMFFLLLLIWSLLGYCYYGISIIDNAIDIPNKNKYKIIILFCGPFVWFAEILYILLITVKHLFDIIDEFAKKK